MKRSTILLTAATSLLLIPSSAALAAGDGFQLHMKEIVVETLQTDVDTNSAKFEEYRDLSNGLRIPLLWITGQSEDGDRTFSFRGENVDRADARYVLDYRVAGRYRVFYDYNKIRHQFGNDGTFLWTETAPGRLEIPDPVQASFEDAIRSQFASDPSGVDADFLQALIGPFQAASGMLDLGLERDRSHARVDVNNMGRLGFSVDVKNERRDGKRPYAGSFGFGNAIEIYEPIDYTTRDIEVSGAWNAEQGGLRLGLRNSRFENSTSTMVWDNPWFVTDSTDSRAYISPGSGSVNGPSLGFADLAPDNEADTIFLDGKLKTDDGWRFSANATFGTMEQDDPLLPYTLNTAIVGIDPDTEATFDPTVLASLPVGNAETEVQTTAFSANVAKELSDSLEISLIYRYYDYDNQSPAVEFPGYVRFHAVWEEVPRVTVPYAYSRDDLGVELDWELSERTDLTFAYHNKGWQRDFREIEDSDEDVFEVTLDTRPSSRVGLRASWQTGDRTTSEYRTEAQLLSFLGEEEVNNSPDLRKFDEAPRQFDDYSFQVRFFPDDRWNLVFGASGRNESYDESIKGLINDDTHHYNGEVSYAPSAAFSFFVFADIADRDSLLRSRQSGATPSTDPLDDWQVRFDETNDTWGLGLTADSSDRLHWDVSANWSDSNGLADFTTPVGGRPAEDIENYEDIELTTVSLKVDYDVSEHAAIGLTYLYEDYTIDSFNLVGLQPFLPSTLLLAANNGNYQADVFGVHLKLGF